MDFMKGISVLPLIIKVSKLLRSIVDFVVTSVCFFLVSFRLINYAVAQAFKSLERNCNERSVLDILLGVVVISQQKVSGVR